MSIEHEAYTKCNIFYNGFHDDDNDDEDDDDTTSTSNSSGSTNKIVFQSKADLPQIRYTDPLCHCTVCLQIRNLKFAHPGDRLRISNLKLHTPPAARDCKLHHTLNDTNGIVVTATAPCLSQRGAG